MPAQSPFTTACDDVVTLITNAITAGDVFSEPSDVLSGDNVVRRYRPRKDLSRLVPGIMHVAVMPSINAQQTSSSRSGERWHFGVQIELHGKLADGIDVDTDEGSDHCDRWERTLFELLQLVRKQSKLSHGASRSQEAEIVYTRANRMLDQRCWSSAVTLPFTVEVDKR